LLAFVAIKPVCSFDACSAQNNYGRDLALHFFEQVGFSMNPPRKWTTRFKYAEQVNGVQREKKRSALNRNFNALTRSAGGSTKSGVEPFLCQMNYK
jgi:hypothetical protein